MIVKDDFHQSHGQELALGPTTHVARDAILWEFSANIGDRIHHKGSPYTLLMHTNPAAAAMGKMAVEIVSGGPESGK